MKIPLSINIRQDWKGRKEKQEHSDILKTRRKVDSIFILGF